MSATDPAEFLRWIEDPEGPIDAFRSVYYGSDNDFEEWRKTMRCPDESIGLGRRILATEMPFTAQERSRFERALHDLAEGWRVHREWEADRLDPLASGWGG